MRLLTTTNAEATQAVAEAIGAQLQIGDLVVLTGDLGAGKTTFAKGLARGLGVTQQVTSPTFTIVQEYDGRVPVAHVDVYRLERLSEVEDLALPEMLEDGCVVVIEWGERARQALPGAHLGVRIERPGDQGGAPDDSARLVHLEPAGPAWEARRADLVRRVLDAT